MKKIILFAFLFPILVFFVLSLLFLGPNIIDAINLRLFVTPEHILNRFYTEEDLAVDQVMDSLILAGPKMAPRLEREIQKREIPRRAHAITALGHLGNNNSISILEQLLQDKGEKEVFRAEALLAIASIDLPYAQKIAPEYLNDTSFVAKCAHEILTDSTSLYKRSYWDALFHRHY